jgi:hypothetical protein
MARKFSAAPSGQINAIATKITMQTDEITKTGLWKSNRIGPSLPV